MTINWGLAQGGGFQNALAMGMQVGQQFRQRREQEDQRSALSAYAIDPNEQNFANIAQVMPEFAIQERGRMEARQAEMRRGELVKAAIGGDANAMQELAVSSFDTWKSLDANQKAQAKQEQEVLGGAALDLLNTPPAQRMAKAQAYAQQLGGQFPEIAQILQLPPDQFEAALRSQVAQAGLVQKMLEMEQPKYMAIPEGGTLVDTRNPAAVSQFGQGANIPPPPPGFTLDGDAGSNASGGF